MKDGKGKCFHQGNVYTGLLKQQILIDSSIKHKSKLPEIAATTDYHGYEVSSRWWPAPLLLELEEATRYLPRVEASYL